MNVRAHGPKVLDALAEKYPQAYFGGMVALSKVIRWEVGDAGAFDRSLTPRTRAAFVSRSPHAARRPRRSVLSRSSCNRLDHKPAGR